MGVLILVLPLMLLASTFESAFAGILAGASETVYGEFPWMAALHYGEEGNGSDAGIRCSGFVINNRFLLTAAHCLQLEKYELKDVWLGVRRISDVETIDVDKVIKFEIEKSIPHERYDAEHNLHDIALLKLKDEINWSDYIGPISLPSSNSALPESGTSLAVVGWGNKNQEGEQADVKLKVEVPLYNHETCLNKLGHSIRSDQFCAGEEQKGTCVGDGGGPLMQALPDGLNKKWYAIGIISGVGGCGKAGLPAVHTRVSSYRYWIDLTMASPVHPKNST